MSLHFNPFIMVVSLGHHQWASYPTQVYGNAKAAKATGAGQVHLLMIAEASQTDVKCKLIAPKSMLHLPIDTSPKPPVHCQPISIE